MNKKYKTYLLLALVIVIWSVIGYRVITYLNPEQPKLTTVMQPKYISKKTDQIKNEFIITRYRDPFLGKIITNKKAISTPKVIPVVFPQIIYNGSIKGAKTILYVITVNNQQEVVKIGKIFQNVKLLRANSTQITVEFQKQTKTILLKK